MDDAHDRGRRPDADRQRQQRRRREAGAAPKLAYGVPEVLKERVDPRASTGAATRTVTHGAALGLDPLRVAQLPGRARDGLLDARPLPHEVVDAMRHVGLELGLEVALLSDLGGPSLVERRSTAAHDGPRAPFMTSATASTYSSQLLVWIESPSRPASVSA